MIDCMGRIVRVGDYVAYAMRKGNSSEMAIGKVLELKAENLNDEPNQIKVISASWLWSYKGTPEKRKSSWWSESQRLVLLDSVSEEIKNLLGES